MASQCVARNRRPVYSADADPLSELKRSPAQRAFESIPNATTLEAGFTTVRDVGSYRAFVDVALRDAIARGWVDGPRMFVAGPYGQTPMEAIRSATVGAAELIGRDDIGALEPGKWADLIVVKGDPLADVTVLEKVSFVMREGKVYKDTRER